MTLATLSTGDWHARAAALRYETGHFIDGKFVDSAARGRFTVVNPATGSPLCSKTLAAKPPPKSPPAKTAWPKN